MSWRTVRTALMATLSMVLVAATLQLALMTRPAAAEEPSLAKCTYHGRLEKEYLDNGTVVWWMCVWKYDDKFHYWKQLAMDPGTSTGIVKEYSDDSPPYHSFVNAGIGHGTSNGIALASYSLHYPNGSPLARRIAVRLEVHNRSTGVRCLNGVWHETYDSVITFEAVYNFPAHCGNGNYETAVHARFFSESLNRWIDNYWTRSGQLSFALV